jgi:hypothetical protein
VSLRTQPPRSLKRSNRLLLGDENPGRTAPAAPSARTALRCSGAEQYELDNVPWFARGVAFGDRVRAELDKNDILGVHERVSRSGRYTVRVIPLGDEPAAEQLQMIVVAFSPLGAECEGALPAFKLVALDIPPTARLAETKAVLRDGEVGGRWGYEEGCVDARWTAL